MAVTSALAAGARGLGRGRSCWQGRSAGKCRARFFGTTPVPANYCALCLVTDDKYLGDDFYVKIQAALEGGVTSVQLRLKNVTTAQYVEWGEKVRFLTSRARVPLIVDDRLDVALAVNADGLHVGLEDLPWSTARRLLGPNKLLGCSTYGRADLIRKALHPEVQADYLGSGTVFKSPTKEKSMPKGPDHLPGLHKTVQEESSGRTVPLMAIGGVTSATASQCIELGADGVAVVSAILQHADAEGVRKATQELSTAIQTALLNRVET